MLPRVARARRWLLLTTGVLVALWIPVSFGYVVYLRLPWPANGLTMSVGGGAVCATLYYGEEGHWQHAGVRVDAIVVPWDEWGVAGNPLIPEFTARERSYITYVTSLGTSTTQLQVPASISANFPLWLLAFLCLAWPVTSFIIARRKRRRGFPIEPAGSAPASAGAERPEGSPPRGPL